MASATIGIRLCDPRREGGFVAPFIGQVSISTAPDGAFGVATSSTRRQFAAVNDNTNTVEIWTVTA